MKLFLEILFIFIAFIYIALMVLLRFAPSGNLVDQELRPLLIKTSFTRTVFQLKQVGDNRFAFASSPSVNVVIHYPSGITPNPELNTWLTDMIDQTLHQPTKIELQADSNLPATGSVTDAQISQIISATHQAVHPGPATLFIYYLPQSTSAPTNAGQAITPQDIVIFTDTIQSLSERQPIRDMIEQSTLMHEWGHELGLDHVNQEDCIMNERVEVYGNRRFQGSNIPTTYCPEELFQLKDLLK